MSELTLGNLIDGMKEQAEMAVIESAAFVFYGRWINEVLSLTAASQLTLDGRIRALAISISGDTPKLQKTAHMLRHWAKGLLSDSEIEAHLLEAGQGLLEKLPEELPDARELFGQEALDNS
jgi:hypothetical protein